MKLEVKQTNKKYILFIDGEEIMSDAKLSIIVRKIEAYLKMRFLKDNNTNKFVDFFKGLGE